MKKRQSAALERKKFLADPVMVCTIVLLIVLLLIAAAALSVYEIKTIRRNNATGN